MKIEYLADNIHFRETIASWFMKEWGSRYPERTLSIWAETQTYLNKDKLPLTLVAIQDNEVVGTVCLRTDGMTTHGEWKAWLSYLVVPESHRGKGIAKELIKQAEKIAKKLGIDELHLFTRLDDPKL
ncbi:MAG: GNAT family N-acetyltransferase, partial [Gammaproteobacteria bacterium]